MVKVDETIIEKVKKFFETHTDKSYRAWQIAEELWLTKEEVSAAIKVLKDQGVIAGRCSYKLAK